MPAEALSSVAPSSEFAVVVSQELTAEAQELLHKMLQSISIENFVVLNSVCEGASYRGLIFLNEKDQNLVAEELASAPSLLIQGFDVMVAAEDKSQVMAYKKQAWADLQNFKKRVF